MYILLLLALLFTACQPNKKTDTIKNRKIAIASTVSIAYLNINYDSCKKSIPFIKETQKVKWKTLSKALKEKCFTEADTNTIILAWIETKWNFNSMSETPSKGYIACGYFVTIVLRNADVKLARIKLAQSTSCIIIKTLLQQKYITRLCNVKVTVFTNFL